MLNYFELKKEVMNQVKGWRTLGLSVAVAVIGAVDAFDWVDIIPANFATWLIPILGIVFGYLRTITTTAAGKSE